MSSVMHSNVNIPNLDNLPPYHIIQFVTRGKQPKLKKIDVVATNWLRFDNKKSKLFVKYPADSPPFNEDLSKEFNDHLRLLNSAPSEWIEWHVKVRGTAETLNEAIKKCNELLLKDKESVLTLDSDESVSGAERRALEKIRQNQFKTIASEIQEKYNRIQHEKSETRSQDVSAPQKKKVKVLLPVKRKPGQSQENTRGDSRTTQQDESFALVEGTGTCQVQNFHESSPEMIELDNSNNVSSGNLLIQDSSSSEKKCSLSHSESSLSRREGRKNSTSNLILGMLTSLSNEVKELRSDNKVTMKSVQNIESIMSRNGVNTVEFVGTVSQINQKFGLDLPFKTVEEFLNFDRTFMTNAQLSSAMSNALQTGFDPSLVISKCLVRMLKMFLDKEVAKKFVARQTVPGKFIMYDTNFYKKIEALIIERRTVSGLATPDREMKASLSAVMSNASSWYKTSNNNNYCPARVPDQYIPNHVRPPIHIEVVNVGPDHHPVTVLNGHNVMIDREEENSQTQMNASNVVLQSTEQLIQPGAVATPSLQQKHFTVGVTEVKSTDRGTDDDSTPSISELLLPRNLTNDNDEIFNEKNVDDAQCSDEFDEDAELNAEDYLKMFSKDPQ